MTNMNQIFRGLQACGAYWRRRWRYRPAPIKPADDAQANAGGMATPGSQQDFVVNVGDRVFFETDSSELTPQSRSTLDKQAQWLGTYNQYAVHHRGPCRRTRHARIQYRPRRAPCADCARLSGLARRCRKPYAHDLLRQGTPGRGLRRYLLLVAEPPRGHCSRRQLVRHQPVIPGRPERAGPGSRPRFLPICKPVTISTQPRLMLRLLCYLIAGNRQAPTAVPLAMNFMKSRPVSALLIAAPLLLLAGDAVAQDARPSRRPVRQYVQSRRAARAHAKMSPRADRCADMAVRLGSNGKRTPPTHRHHRATAIRNQQLEMQLKRMQDDTEYRFQQLGSQGAPGAPPRATQPSAPDQRWASAWRYAGPPIGRVRSSQHPNAPGAPRTLGSETVVAPPAAKRRQRAAGRRARRPCRW